VLALQQCLGNAAVARLVDSQSTQPVLSRSEAPEATAEPAPGADGELVRLEEEILKLGQRNAWTGVVRNYKKIEELGLGPERVKRSTHYLAVQGEVKVNGITQRFLDLLERTIGGPAAKEDSEDAVPACRAMRDQIINDFREVSITPSAQPEEDDKGGGGLFGGKKDDGADEGPKVDLEPEVRPFGGLAKEAVEAAERKLADDGWFKGYLPYGRYTLNGRVIEVTLGVRRLELPY
jgi:hypothetical protein